MKDYGGAVVNASVTLTLQSDQQILGEATLCIARTEFNADRLVLCFPSGSVKSVMCGFSALSFEVNQPPLVEQTNRRDCTALVLGVRELRRRVASKCGLVIQRLPPASPQPLLGSRDVGWTIKVSYVLPVSTLVWNGGALSPRGTRHLLPPHAHSACWLDGVGRLFPCTNNPMKVELSVMGSSDLPPLCFPSGNVYRVPIPVLPDCIGFSLGRFRTKTCGNSQVQVAALGADIHAASGLLGVVAKAACKLTELVGGELPFVPCTIAFVAGVHPNGLPAVSPLTVRDTPPYCWSPPRFRGFAGLVLMDASVLSSDNELELQWEAARQIAEGLTNQVFGVLVSPEKAVDAWLIKGLASHLAQLVFQELCGVATYRYLIWREIGFVCENDSRSSPPLSDDSGNAVDSLGDVARRKAGLVVRMLRDRVGHGGFTAALKRIVSAAVSDQSVGSKLSFNSFLTILHESAGEVFNRDQSTDFVERWVHGSGCPILGANLVLKKRPNLSLKFIMMLSRGDFAGTFRVRIRECDEVYDEEVEIDGGCAVWEISCRKSRRPGWQSADENEKEACDRVNAVISVFPTPILWLEMDPEQKQLCRVDFMQPDLMWAAQLHASKDVVAQAEAVRALSLPRYATPYAFSALEKVVESPRFFHAIRSDAAAALVAHATRAQGESEVEWIVNFCRRKLMITVGGLSYIRPNDFTDVVEHLMFCSLIQVAPAGNELFNLLIRAVSENDNSQNAFSDTFYLGVLLYTSALAVTSTVAAAEWQRVALVAINREKVLPSRRCERTVASLRGMGVLLDRGFLETCHVSMIVDCLSPSCSLNVREAAARVLVVACSRDLVDLFDVLDVLYGETCPHVRHAMADELWGDLHNNINLKKRALACTPESRNKLERLWRRVNSFEMSVDGVLCHDLFSVYFSLYGKDLPAPFDDGSMGIVPPEKWELERVWEPPKRSFKLRASVGSRGGMAVSGSDVGGSCSEARTGADDRGSKYAASAGSKGSNHVGFSNASSIIAVDSEADIDKLFVKTTAPIDVLVAPKAAPPLQSADGGLKSAAHQPKLQLVIKGPKQSSGLKWREARRLRFRVSGAHDVLVTDVTLR